jgi:hypothetical protein
MFVGHILEAILNADPWTLFSAGFGSALQGARNALNEALNPVNEVKKTLKEFAENHLDPGDIDGIKEAVERVKQLAEDVKTEGETVFQNISDQVNKALSAGQIPDEGDGGLGQTHDNFTPGSDKFPVGQVPGVDISGGVGLDRTGDSGGSVDAGGGLGAGGGSGNLPPLGASGSGAGTSSSSTSSTAVAPPTPGDLGLDPNSGAYIEYQPSQGQAQITYPDGTTETRPWPPH